jgi:hypothetical protein
MKTNIIYTIALGLACLALPLRAVALLPAPTPDGGYPNANTAEGNYALYSLTTGFSNSGCGRSALYSITSGDSNTAVGDQSLFSVTDGNDNTAIGAGALYFNSASNNTAIGRFALQYNGSGADNTATGARALLNNTTGAGNTADGSQALISNTSGANNTAAGIAALYENTMGNFNTAFGTQALESNTTASKNTALGFWALIDNTTGANNIAVGYQAGINLTTGSNNIDIGASGPAGEANTIRIGKQGTQKKTFVAGIRGVTVASGVGVIVGTTGQLGTVISSARFKTAIKPMDETSETILALKPVTFRYKEELDPDKIPQFGLVAEEVEKVNPDLVARDEEGRIMSVRYEAVNAMLLNEFLKEHRKVEELEKQIKALTAIVQKVSNRPQLGTTVPQVKANN